MGDKDLEDIISNIGQDEIVMAQKQAQIDRLKQLIQRQKNEMAEQEKLIKELQNRADNMYDLPPDIEELKRMVGEMRAELNRKDHDLEMAYGTIAQREAELKNTQIQFAPLSQQLNTYITQVGELRAKIIEQTGILAMRDKELQELRMANTNSESNLERMEVEFAMRIQQRLKQFMETEDQYKARIAKMEEEFDERTRRLQAQSMDTEDQYQARIAKLEIEYRTQIKGLQDEFREKEDQYQTKIRTIQQQDGAQLRRLEEDYGEKMEKLRRETQQQLAEAQKMAKEAVAEGSSAKNKLVQAEAELDALKADFAAQSESYAKLKSTSDAMQVELAKLKADARSQFVDEKMALEDKIVALESVAMDKDIRIKELEKVAERADTKVNEYKQKFTDAMDKYDKFNDEYDALAQKLKETEAQQSDLVAFRDKNQGSIKNLEGLLQLFEQETLFKTFLLVKDVGEMNTELLRSALGVPSITVKKYIDQFIKADLFELLDNGKVRLKYKM